MDVKSNTTFYYWVSKKYGVMMSTNNKCPYNKKRDGKISYLGFTNDADYPKRLNTGRLLHKHTRKKRRDGRKK